LILLIAVKSIFTKLAIRLKKYSIVIV